MGADPASTVATWLWQAGKDIREIVAFVTARGLREVCLAVPLRGVDEDVAALTSALRANGIAVSCLGGDPMWAVEHDVALNWAFRATADAVFDGVHLDVEPWALPDWPEDAAALMASYSVLVEEMTEIAPLAVDLAPWLVDDHRDVVTHIAQQCDSVTVLAYRDDAASIVAAAAGMIALCESAGTSYRVGVETQASVVIDTEQNDVRRRRRGGDAQGAHPRQRSATTSAVRRVRHPSPWLVANHAAVTGYSRPADTQLISWNLLPDTASAAASSVLI